MSDSFNSTMAFLNRFFRAVKIQQTKVGANDGDVRRLAGLAAARNPHLNDVRGMSRSLLILRG